MDAIVIAISVVLIPGLMSSIICDKIVVHVQRWDAFKYITYSFVFGVLSYALLQVIVHIKNTYQIEGDYFVLASPFPLSIWSIIQDQKSPIKLTEVVQATLISPIVSLAAAAIVNWKVLNKIAQWLAVSSKYGDENLFSFFLNSKEVEWVYVRDKGAGLTYFGAVISYSDCDRIQEIVMSEVIVYDYETSDELYKIASIYLTKNVGEFVIEVPEVT